MAVCVFLQFRAALRQLNIRTDDDFLDVYEAIDTDGSGYIDKYEFCDWWLGLEPS